MLKCSICGMIINERNYNVNNGGIPEENSLNQIKYCPFCGATYEYLGSVNEEIIKADIDKLNENTIKILDHAMKLEVFNSEFYLEAAKLVENEQVKKMFSHLSTIELVHAKVHQRMGGFKELPVLNKLDYTKYRGEGGDKDLLEVARKREMHAVDYYKKYINEVNHGNVKKIFEALSEVEKDHVEMEEAAL